MKLQQDHQKTNQKYTQVSFVFKNEDYIKIQHKIDELKSQIPAYNTQIQENLIYKDLIDQNLVINQNQSTNTKFKPKKSSEDFEKLDLDFDEKQITFKEGNQDSEFNVKDIEEDSEFQLQNEADQLEAENNKNKIQEEGDPEQEEQTAISKQNQRIQKVQKICANWLQIPYFGKVLKDTNIIPGKTPLLKGFWKSLYQNQDERFQFRKILQDFKDQNTPIKVIIDLTDNKNYYNFNALKKKDKYGMKDILKDVQYYQFPLKQDQVPRKSEMNKIYSTMNKFAFQKDTYVYVHCFSGRDRTNYVCCYYLCKLKSIKPEEAMKAFEVSRGFGFQNQDFVTDLKEKFDY